ncbi:hypothetical protein EYV94_27935 [Puteibacter caeruleilacunae]|nr:hypothetical protein EYV94_27935 [Puteibacter caeruleilacunae]
MKRIIILIQLIFICSLTNAQEAHTSQNGIGTSVITGLSAGGTQAKRYTIAEVGYNSYHWQTNAMVIVELFSKYFSVGYEKYIVHLGYENGTQSSQPVVEYIESIGTRHSGRVVIGVPEDLPSSRGGYVNRKIDINVDVREYGSYYARITYILKKVDEVTAESHIKVIDQPTGVNISDFWVTPVVRNVSGLHIKNGTVDGKLGIGTRSPNHPLDVVGTVRAHEIIVSKAKTADFVFEEGYKLQPLEKVEKYIKEHKHLPQVHSANTMKRDGVKQSEMNQVLLQKIEELTLHLIKKEHEVKELNLSLKQKDKDINDLEKRLEKVEEYLINH